MLNYTPSNYTPAEILLALESSKNINAAIKKFLKNDVGNNPKNARFAKNLKLVLASRDSAAKDAHIAKQLPEFEPHLLVMGRYAFVEQVDSITSEVIEKFAEEFNQTYVSNATGIEIKDAAKFGKIVTEVDALVTDRLSRQNLPASNFMKRVLFSNIFESGVLEKVLPLVSKGES